MDWIKQFLMIKNNVLCSYMNSFLPSLISSYYRYYNMNRESTYFTIFYTVWMEA